MNNFIRKLIVLLMLLSPIFAAAAQTSQSVSLYKVFSSDIDDDEIEVPVKRHRLPSAPIECVITSDGICVHDSSVNLAEAISYEIWDAESEWCVASFSDEFSFIESLFAMSGEFQIRIVFSDYELVGNVCI